MAHAPHWLKLSLSLHFIASSHMSVKMNKKAKEEGRESEKSGVGRELERVAVACKRACCEFPSRESAGLREGF